jgi:hypothetical protein
MSALITLALLSLPFVVLAALIMLLVIVIGKSTK